MRRQAVWTLRWVAVGVLTLTCVLWLPAPAAAQDAAAITGTVKDTTGSVLPGVTVEARSPALIEGVRTAVTDGQGVYRIIELRPGIYGVTFTLPGFSTVQRGGIRLLSGFTATVHVEMSVGGVAETVTVTAEQPLVDTQTVTQRRVLDAEFTESLPVSSVVGRSPAAYTRFLTGVDQDEAGSREPNRDQRRISVRGAPTSDSVEALEGAKYPMLNGGGGGQTTTIYFNAGNIEEVQVDTSGLSIENQHGGMTTNIIPKTGSNTFAAEFLAAYSNDNLQNDNLTDELRAQGLDSVNSTKKLWDYNGSFGGPIMRDRLWLWSSFRYSGNELFAANVFENATPAPAWTYVPDLNRPFVQRNTFESYSARLTWQATQRHKFSAFYDNNTVCFCNRTNANTAIVAPEAATNYLIEPNYLAQLTWKMPATTRVFLEANVLRYHGNTQFMLQPDMDPDIVPAVDRALNIFFRNHNMRTSGNGERVGPQHHETMLYRAAASYVTGSHNVKVGVQFRRGLRVTRQIPIGGGIQVNLRNGVPFRVEQFAFPGDERDHLDADGGVFAGDQWTIRRLTVNFGARWEFLNASVEPISLPAGPFVPAREFEEVSNVPNWDDVSPRFAFAYDLFGNGRTAIKGTLGKYVTGQQLDLAGAANPQLRSIQRAQRNWNDRNGNFVPDCDLNNPLANGECGTLDNLNFGRNNPNATQFDEDLLRGSGKRQSSWEQSIQFEHQLMTGLSVNAGYFRRAFRNFQVTDNLQVTPDDFDPFFIVAPVDPRLPGGGGFPVTGLYDVKPSLRGRVTNFTTRAKNFGKQTQVSNFIDIGTSVRMRGTQIQAGVSTGRTATDRCFVIDSPQQLLYCDVTPPFQATYKFLGAIPLRVWDLQVAAAFVNSPGPEILAEYVAGADEIQGLGRNLASGATGTATVPLIAPGTLFADRVTTLDGRITKQFRIGPTRIQGSLDALNLFNSSDVLRLNDTFGDRWLEPTRIVNGRVFKFTVRVSY